MGLLDDDDYFLVIISHLESDRFLTKNIDSYEEVCLETSYDQDDLQVNDTPWELKEEIKSTIDEVNEINFNIIKDHHLTFHISLLNETKINGIVRFFRSLGMDLHGPMKKSPNYLLT